MKRRRKHLDKGSREPGAIVVLSGQRDRIEEYECCTGRITLLGVWRSNCPECGAAFECRTTVAQPPSNRRCAKHKAQRRRVTT